MKSDLIYEKQIDNIKICDDALAYYNGIEAPLNIDRRCNSCGTLIKKSHDAIIHPWHNPGFEWMHLLNSELAILFREYSSLYTYANYPALKIHFVSTEYQIQHYKKGEGYPMFHSEWAKEEGYSNRYCAWMLYLNDVPDGGTEFLYQNKIVEAKKGKLIMWPAYWTHTHRGIVSQTQDKYVITGWGTHHVLNHSLYEK